MLVHAPGIRLYKDKNKDTPSSLLTLEKGKESFIIFALS
jgi:hypothetical protein